MAFPEILGDVRGVSRYFTTKGVLKGFQDSRKTYSPRKFSGFSLSSTLQNILFRYLLKPKGKCQNLEYVKISHLGHFCT